MEILERNDQVRVVIVTGAGEKAFCAGRDLNQSKSFQQASSSELEAAWDLGDRLIDRILFYPKLTVAALNGVALGGGCELTLPFDFVIAQKGIRIGLPETLRGLFPGPGAMNCCPRRWGSSRRAKLFSWARSSLPRQRRHVGWSMRWSISRRLRRRWNSPRAWRGSRFRQ